ncbi:MAG: type II secretion system F family protein [Candidatus Altiarchaeota archaeon]|nr:type II secretion system F family protein [Candidatus Altiarchaeota archaeon]
MKRIFRSFSKVFPKSFLEDTHEMLRFADFELDAEIWLGEIVTVALCISAVMVWLSTYSSSSFFILSAVIVPIIYLVGAYSIPFFIAEDRAEKVEKILPNALQLMSSNILAGMTPFQAMKLASRDEFGALKNELDRVTAKSLGTESFSTSVKEIAKHIRLPALERSLKLFVRSIESGGHLSKVLDETAKDINDSLMLKQEMISNVRSYAVLIVLTVMIGAPLLFNVSILFTERLNTLKQGFSTSSAEDFGMDLLVSESFDPNFLIGISAVIVAVTSTIASLLIGVIVSGKEKYGIRYAFVMVPTSLIIFYGVRIIVHTLV